ncbi:hypothetical protein [Leptospira noguchii]|uniref:hypothetical protein n=1 Tax=Leptospira noguchii TaxID=28182 RepID=UPI0002F5007A|nr:hypothetical protein [Leptospira noguchii]UOG31219.1 hypothetical protein MAL06_03995 [Leptospira noguchii]UOG53374.1 hypothetical protein MAL09_04140 [Leptospira noguchii]
MFPVCNLLTRAESPTGCLWQAGFAPVFLRRTHVNSKKKYSNILLLHLKYF